MWASNSGLLLEVWKESNTLSSWVAEIITRQVLYNVLLWRKKWHRIVAQLLNNRTLRYADTLHKEKKKKMDRWKSSKKGNRLFSFLYERKSTWSSDLLYQDRSNLYNYSSGSVSNFIINLFLRGLEPDCDNFFRPETFP